MAREIDDTSKRKQYKQGKFDGKKSMRDEYTGKTIYASNAGLERKHSAKKVSDTDHITPIDVIEKRYGGLTREQQRKLANSSSNLAMTNSSLNRSKGGLENHKYLYREWENGDSEDLKTTITMLTKEAQSRIDMRVKATEIYVSNATDNFKGKVTSRVDVELLNKSGEKAAQAAMTATTTSAIHNIYAVASGEKDVDEAARDVLETTGSALVMQGVKTYCEEKSWKAAAKLTTEEACVFLRDKVSNCAGQIACGIETSKILVKYIDGQIDADECAFQIGIGMAGYMAYIVGEAILPPIGGIAAQMITESVCRAICIKVMEIKENIRENKKKLHKINIVLNDAICEMQCQQRILADEIREVYSKWDEKFELGFSIMLQAIPNNDFENFSNGLDIVLQVFDSQVIFKTEKEFDDFFFDDSAVLNL